MFHLNNKCLQVFASNKHAAALWSYSVDATPLKTTTTHGATQGHQSVVRHGKVLREFLLQRGMVRARPASWEDQIASLLIYVLPLTEGKKA